MRTKMQAKRKLSTDSTVTKSCCQRLSIIACVCAVVSLLVNIYNYVERDGLKDSLNIEASNLMQNVLDDKLEERIEAYFKEVTRTTSLRVKREALLVRASFIVIVNYDRRQQNNSR